MYANVCIPTKGFVLLAVSWTTWSPPVSPAPCSLCFVAMGPCCSPASPAEQRAHCQPHFCSHSCQVQMGRPRPQQGHAVPEPLLQNCPSSPVPSEKSQATLPSRIPACPHPRPQFTSLSQGTASFLPGQVPDRHTTCILGLRRRQPRLSPQRGDM